MDCVARQRRLPWTATRKCRAFPRSAVQMRATQSKFNIRRNKYDPDTYHVATSDSRAEEDWKAGPRYELLHYLGSGSFSRVCAARDTETGVVVSSLI